MARRQIVIKGDPVLEKKCRPVENFDERLWNLLDDMAETLEAANGVGLAAPQIGVLRRIFIMNLGGVVIEAINPKISRPKGSQRDLEGCLSCPKDWGYVTRPMRVRLEAQNRKGEFYALDLKELGARCACHETDHLDGKLFDRLIEERVHPEDIG